MTQISELRKRIIENLSPCFVDLGLKQAFDNVFWSSSPDMAHIVQISFLDSQQASYFGSTTASFSIEYGGLYGMARPFEIQKDYPYIHYCQVRGVLGRDFQQDVPKKSLTPVEHRRRDIWWVDASGENTDKVVESAVRVVKNDLGLWLSRLSNYHYLCRYLFWKNENHYGLYGFGRKGSPMRIRVLGLLAEKFPNKTMLKWRILLPTWLTPCRS
jgi:hypothetical protein